MMRCRVYLACCKAVWRFLVASKCVSLLFQVVRAPSSVFGVI
jgi:hypothetical protein